MNRKQQQHLLSDDLLKACMQTHNFAKAFFHEIMLAADLIMNKETDKQIQINALVWKINAANKAKNTIFQNNPEIALLDTWIFVSAMTDFLEHGASSFRFFFAYNYWFWANFVAGSICVICV